MKSAASADEIVVASNFFAVDTNDAIEELSDDRGEFIGGVNQ